MRRQVWGLYVRTRIFVRWRVVQPFMPLGRERLGRAYEQAPARITRLVESTCEAASTGRLKMPDVYLDKKLREEL